ncbi:helix-turn-helix domain-containing protein [Armatimonas sp.]|uniref:helix-turn-helix domain-containing protein n=1 Tax=Armatimonas sp. TaxID=1872638 RepID=UPI00286CCB09|nr:helix-turn-helix domain-containing protein [Armatimonas sp.]
MARVEPAAELKHRSPVDAKGYTMLMNCVLYDQALSDGAKVTYIVLLDYARQDDSCFPGQLKLAERRDTTERTIRNHLSELEKRGLVTIEQRGHMKTNVYWLEEIRAVYTPPQESDRKNSSGHDRKFFAAHDRKNFSAKEDAVVKRLRYKKTEALNVREDGEETSAKERPTPSTEGKGIYAIRDKAVTEVVTLTGDEGSLRRFQQLWEVAEGKGALNAWEVALRATQRRLRSSSKQVLDRPGAYFDKICVGELEKREVFVPTISEKQAETGVGELIRQGLFGGESTPASQNELLQTTPENQKQLASQVELTPAALDAELMALECKGGAPHEAFRVFCNMERKRYESEIGKVSVASRERLLAVFDRPEKRRDLYRKWRNTTDEVSEIG